MHGEMRYKHCRVPLVIVSCAILHNLATLRNLPDNFENFGVENDDDYDENFEQNVQDGLVYRNTFVANWF